MAAAAPLSNPDANSKRSALLGALREALVTMLAAISTLLCTLAIARGPGPAVLAVVLCLSLSRSQLDRDWRHRVEAAIALPLVALVAVGAGFLLHHAPWLGAAAFVAGMFVSIWLRRFGANAQRAGSLIALPFVTLLVTPHISAAESGPVPPLLLPVIVALLALAWVSVLHALAQRIGLLAPPPVPRSPHQASARESTLRPIASTRMAIQMAVALALAFVAGYVFFAQHWAWIVLTAYIVMSGNRGRLDVAYKSLLRVAGAAGGTVLALALSIHPVAHGYGSGVLIIFSLFVGLWLRPLGYAWWALFVTIALALLQGFADTPPLQILWPRLEEIFIGAILSVATAWWLLPVSSTGTLRRRLADALASLASALDPATRERTPDAFIVALGGVEQVAPAFRASRFLTRHLLRRRDAHPADWIATLLACRNPAVALIESGDTPADVRRAVGAARKALLEPATLLAALQSLLQALTPRPADADALPSQDLHADAGPGTTRRQSRIS